MPGTAWIEQACRIPLDGGRTPAARRRLAAACLAAACAGGAAAALAPTAGAAAMLAALSVAPLAWATRAWRASRAPVYVLAEREQPLPVIPWEIRPGIGIGPVELGPPGPEVLRLLRAARACWLGPGWVTYILGAQAEWLAIRLTCRHEGGPPEPAGLLELVWVETSHPFHSTPGGVSPGLQAREVAARLGPPLDVWRAAGEARLHYPGLQVALRDGRVRSLRVLTTDPLEACRPWHVL